MAAVLAGAPAGHPPAGSYTFPLPVALTVAAHGGTQRRVRASLSPRDACRPSVIVKTSRLTLYSRPRKQDTFLWQPRLQTLEVETFASAVLNRADDLVPLDGNSRHPGRLTLLRAERVSTFTPPLRDAVTVALG